MKESTILRQIRQAVNLSGKARLVRNSVGYDSEAHVRYGLGVGSPDLVGVLRGGRALALEVKSATGRVRPEQAAWLAAFERLGGVGGVVRSVEEAMNVIDRALG